MRVLDRTENTWRKTLYDAYVTTGQATHETGDPNSFATADYPYYKRLIARHLADTEKTARIVDLACGHGDLLQSCRHAGFLNLEGIDNSPEQVDLAHRKGADMVEHASIEDYLDKSNGAFDVVFLMDILEHLERGASLKLLTNIHARMSDKGKVIIHVPNAEGIHGMRMRYGDLTHEIAFTRRSMTQLLRAAGFMSANYFEDSPVVHWLSSAIRYALWQLMTIWSRALLFVELGGGGHILSQNMLVVVENKRVTEGRISPA